MSSSLIDDEKSLRFLMESINHDSPGEQLIFIDLEGVDLGRNGSIAIMQVLIPPIPKVHLIDVHVLQHNAFKTPCSRGHTLKEILEGEAYAKVFFDVRNDSDALFSHFNVNLNGVIDLQLLEYATRGRRGGYLKGLSKCISECSSLSREEKQKLQEDKSAGQRLFKPEQGGRYEVFLERPLATSIIKYCVGDVMIMPSLLSTYGERLTPDMGSQINAEALRRVAISQKSDFNGTGKHMAIGPSHMWGKSAFSIAVPFPMSLVCSRNLDSMCRLNEPESPVVSLPEELTLYDIDSFLTGSGFEAFLTENMSFLQKEAAKEARRHRRNDRRRRE